MNKVLIVEASESDSRLMAGLFVKSGYGPIAVETMETAKDEVALSPWRSQRNVERNCPPGAENVVQRLGVDKQLPEVIRPWLLRQYISKLSSAIWKSKESSDFLRLLVIRSNQRVVPVSIYVKF